MLTLNDGRSELWQWDTGRTLAVDADCSQVHFSNKVFGRSIDIDVIDGVATIPDILLQTDKDLNVWAFVGTAENGYTKISKTFKVNRRNKPADYVFTPPDQTSLEEIKERIDALEEKQDPDAIKNAVDDYLANNPVRIDEKDPTVSDWAKQPKKPDYTATEVGAVATVNGQTPDKNGNVEIEVSGGNVDLTGYAKEQWVQQNYQPKGDYALKSQIPVVPTKVSAFENDKGYLTQHQDISGKLDATALPEAIDAALAQAKASGEFDGKDGEKGDKGDKGDTGSPGVAGTSVTVKSVSESAADGGSNVVTFSDGKTVTIKNGSKGSTGKTGAPGYTPVRGTDYWTPADQEAVVQQVLTVMGMHIVGVVGTNNDIVFTGNLPEGTYQLKYEDVEGNVQQIGTIEVGAEELVNWLPISVGADGSIYNADDTPGYKANTRYSASSDAEKNYPGCYVTGYIAVKKDQTLRVANMIMDKNATDGNMCFCYLFDTAKANAKIIRISGEGTYTFDGLGAVWNDNGYLTQFTIPEDGFIRLQASYIGSDSAVTLE